MEIVEGVLRGFSYAALVLVVGTTVYWHYVLPGGFAVRAVRRLVAGGLALTVVASIGELVAVAAATHSDLFETIASRAGTALVLRMALAALLAAWTWQLCEHDTAPVAAREPAPLAVPVSAGRPESSSQPRAAAAGGFGGVLTAGLDWSDEPAAPARPAETDERARHVGVVAGGLLLLLFCATWVLPSRSAVGHYPGVKAPLDLVHVVAVTIWLGGLLSVLVALSAAVDAERLVDLLPRVTLLSAVSLLALLATGVGQSLAEAAGGLALGRHAVRPDRRDEGGAARRCGRGGRSGSRVRGAPPR